MPAKPKSTSDKSSKSFPIKQVKFIQGATDILIIVPYGASAKGVKKDDDETHIVADTIAKELGCSALINNSIKRTEMDYKFFEGVR